MKSNKNIVIITPSLAFGGAERVATILASELCRFYEIYLIVFYKSEKEYKVVDSVNVIYLSETYCPSKNLYETIKNNIKNLIKINKIFNKYSIDLVISLTTNVNILSLILGILKNKKIIISERNNPNFYKHSIVRETIRNTLYPFCNLLVLQTERVRAYYSNFVALEKLEIIPNPLKVSVIHEGAKLPRENIILTVGRLDNNKNQIMIIKAFAEIKIENWKLIIIGEGTLRDNLEIYVQKNDLSSKIIFLGGIMNVNYYYKISKVFVLASKSEGFPNVLLEAMSEGLACISTNCDYGPSELIDDGENGFLVVSESVHDLKNKLFELIVNQDLQNKFGENAKFSSKNYSSDIVVNKWRKTINKVLLEKN